MWKALYSTDRSVAESVGVRQELSKLRRMVKELSLVLDREPTVQELADAMGIAPEKVHMLCLWRDQAVVESVEEIQNRQVAADREPFCSLYAVSSEDETPAALRRVVCAALQVLTPRQREIIEARYGFGEGCTRMRTADEVAECLGVVQQTVLEMESWAMKHLAFFLAPLVASGRPSVRSAAGCARVLYRQRSSAIVGGDSCLCGGSCSSWSAGRGLVLRKMVLCQVGD